MAKKATMTITVDQELMDQVNAFANQANISRSAAGSMLMTMSLNMADRLMNPEKWLIDPLVVDAIKKAAEQMQE